MNERSVEFSNERATAKAVADWIKPAGDLSVYNCRLLHSSLFDIFSDSFRGNISSSLFLLWRNVVQGFCLQCYRRRLKKCVGFE